jgi:hypothetical protein
MIEMEDGEVQQLTTDNTEGVGTCSIELFLEWFEEQTEQDAIDITTDPYKLALKNMVRGHRPSDMLSARQSDYILTSPC